MGKCLALPPTLPDPPAPPPPHSPGRWEAAVSFPRVGPRAGNFSSAGKPGGSPIQCLSTPDNASHGMAVSISASPTPKPGRKPTSGSPVWVLGDGRKSSAFVPTCGPAPFPARPGTACQPCSTMTAFSRSRTWALIAGKILMSKTLRTPRRTRKRALNWRKSGFVRPRPCQVWGFSCVRYLTYYLIRAETADKPSAAAFFDAPRRSET